MGQTYLESGEPSAALRPLARAIGKKSRIVSSAAVLGLALSHALTGDNIKAIRVLENSRTSTESRHASLDDMLSAYLRYRTSPTSGRRFQLEENLREVLYGQALDMATTYLVGQAYRELGQHHQMVNLYEKAVDFVRGPLAVRMTFELAEYFDLIDARKEARSRYLAVSAVDANGLGGKAQLALADLAARDGKGTECLARC